MNCFGTIVTHSYLVQALALRASLTESKNSEVLHVLVVDYPKEDSLPRIQGIVYHDFTELDEMLPPLMKYYFDAFELCNALKPFFVSFLTENGADTVIYLDSDIMAVGSFKPAWEQIQNKAVLITPHQLTPPPLNLDYTNEIEIVDQGIFNGGFMVFQKNEITAKILDWMKERYSRLGFNARKEGMFVDQKLLPFLPVYFPDHVEIWRNPCVNIAFWNAHERPVVEKDDNYSLRGEPVVFFHISGFRLSHSEKICSYLSETSNAKILSVSPWISEVISKYKNLLVTAPSSVKITEYPFNRYKNYNLTPGLRRILFNQENLTPNTSGIKRVLFTDWLKKIKRRVTGWF